MKAELFSTSVRTGAGIFLVDPIPLDGGSIAELIGDNGVAGIVITNGNHHRAAEDYSEIFSAPIYARTETGIASAIEIGDGEVMGCGLKAVRIDGAPAGEVALFVDRESGTLIMGDALINFGSAGFDFLPAKYCSNQKLMRQSLRRLLDYPFERILFAHGAPIMSQAKPKLIALLDGIE